MSWKGGQLSAATEDFSPSGLFVETANPAPLGTEVRFEGAIVGDPRRQPVVGTGRVVRVLRSADTSPADPVPGMGIRIDRLIQGKAELMDAAEPSPAEIRSPPGTDQTPEPPGDEQSSAEPADERRPGEEPEQPPPPPVEPEMPTPAASALPGEGSPASARIGKPTPLWESLTETINRDTVHWRTLTRILFFTLLASIVLWIGFTCMNVFE